MLSQKHASTEIYEFDRALERTINAIKKELSQNNQKVILEYDKSMARQSISKAARRIHAQNLLSLTRLLQKDWKDVTKSDIDELVYKIMDTYADVRGQETWSSYDSKKVLKMFYRWYKLGSREFSEVGDPPETKSVKTKPVRDTLAREELLTESDLTRLLHACGENARDRAFIDTHAEAGTRPGEILNLQIKHVKFDEYGAIIHVNGKTGTRNIRLIRSVPNLAHWIDVHPYRNDPASPLWIMLKTEKYGQPLTHAAASKMLKLRCKKANIEKRVNLKLFRHTEATNSATFMTEAQLKKRHGWSAVSSMPSRYVHMIDADVEDAIFKHHGIKKEAKQDDRNALKICHMCNVSNSPESTICSKCGKPLSLESAISIEEESQNKQKQTDARFSEMAQKIKSLEQKLESEEFAKRFMTTILYKNRDKIPGLSIKIDDPKHLLDFNSEELGTIQKSDATVL